MNLNFMISRSHMQSYIANSVLLELQLYGFYVGISIQYHTSQLFQIHCVNSK